MPTGRPKLSSASAAELVMLGPAARAQIDSLWADAVVEGCRGAECADALARSSDQSVMVEHGTDTVGGDGG